MKFSPIFLKFLDSIMGAKYLSFAIMSFDVFFNSAKNLKARLGKACLKDKFHTHTHVHTLTHIRTRQFSIRP